MQSEASYKEAAPVQRTRHGDETHENSVNKNKTFTDESRIRIQRAVSSLNDQATHLVASLAAQAEEQKQQFNLDVTETLAEEERALQTEYNEQVTLIRKQLAEQEARLKREAQDMIAAIEEEDRQSWRLFFRRMLPCVMRVTPRAPETSKAVTKQRDVYIQLTREQCLKNIAVVDTQVETRRKYMRFQAEQQKKQFAHLTEMEMKREQMKVQQECWTKFMDLQKESKKHELEADSRIATT